MRLKYDPIADAAYVEVHGPVLPGAVDLTEPLDQDRLLDYDADDRVIGYEFLNVRRYGVRLDDLEHREDLSRLFREAGFQERTWGTPWGSGRRVKRPPGGWPKRGPVPGRR
jgi:uncharacterized protein YuzE